jgi:DNA polymerase-3 subunit alpha
VDKSYVKAKENPRDISYIHPIVKEHTKETYGFLIFQEQIAMLAHKLGKDISLDEGNLLRKVLTKKGTGKGARAKKKIYDKFIAGCEEKGIKTHLATELWQTFEYFSGYGFNKSHAVSYCFLSYQCAWLLNYYPAEWVAAFLDKEPETRKEKAINIAKSIHFEIEGLNINTSGKVWEISEDGKTLIQPLSSCKGIGDAAIEQIIGNRPYQVIEDFIFNEDIIYSKVNKRVIDILIRSGTLDGLIDERFTGAKHFWSAVAVDRPRNQKKLEENIETYSPEGDFNDEERIEYLVNLTGVFPMERVITGDVLRKLQELRIPPLGEYDPNLLVCWFIPRKIIPKKTKKGKDYWIVECIDDTSTTTRVRCWGVNPRKDKIHLNHPYMAKLDYSPDWGFSTRAVGRTFKMLG